VENKYAKTMTIEAKYSLVSKQYPINLSKEEIKKLNYDTFKIAKLIEIKRIKVKNKEELEY